MTDFFKDLVKEHFALLFGTFIGFVLLFLGLALKLFHELRTDPTATKKALLGELFFLAKLRAIFSKTPPAEIIKPGEVNPLAQTITPGTQPIVPPPGISPLESDTAKESTRP